MVQNPSLDRIERVCGVAETASGKLPFGRAQESVALLGPGKTDRHAACVIGRIRRGCAKLADGQPAEPRQCCPAQLVDHLGMTRLGRKAKKAPAARPTARKASARSTVIKVRQPSPPERSPNCTASSIR